MKFAARRHHSSPCFLKSIGKEKKTKYIFLPSLFFISRTLKGFSHGTLGKMQDILVYQDKR
jgi:hypothetical protein